MPEPDDPQLMARAQGGDMDAIGSLYDRHRESIFRYLWLRLGDRHQAEDLTGDVFMRMLDALPHFQAVGIPFRAWLYRIAHNLLVDHFRKTNAHVSISLDAVEDQGDSDPILDVDRKILFEQVNQALAQLDRTQHEVIVLRFLLGLSLQEVAAAMGKSEAAIKSLQHRGLNALRMALYQAEE